MSTINDVARLAGVSTMTVSRVLNDSANVSAHKREAVMQAVAALNYHPNLVARSLATSRSGTIGMVVTEMGNPIYPSYTEGVSERLRKAGLDAIVYYASSFLTTQAGIHTLLSKQVDGLILLPLEIHEMQESKELFARTFAETIRRSGKPMVMIGNSFLEGFPYVAEDYAAGAGMAVEYLYEMGHRDIGYLQCIKTDYPWNERTDGYTRTMARLGCAVKDAWCPHIPEGYDNITASIGAWIHALRQNGRPLPTAMYCANDLIAVGALYALQREGLRVPEDISIIGHDGIAYTEYSYPRITTIALTPHKTGIATAQSLLDMMQGKEKKVVARKLMPPKLKKGATVKGV